MKAVRFHTCGGPEVLSFEDVSIPAIPPGNVLIKTEAIGVNFLDTYQRSGLYPVPLPCIAGNEAAGTVERAAADVKGFEPGNRVAFAGIIGAYAQYVSVPADQLVPVPHSLDTEAAAAVLLQGLTAHYLSSSTYELKPGDICLIHAAAGGVGLLLIQMAKARGSTVIGTVSTAAKGELARGMGADLVINYAEADFEEEVRRFTGGLGVQVVYDSIGKSTFEKSLKCLAPRGYLVLFGQSSGPVGRIDPLWLVQNGSLFLTRPALRSYIATRSELERRAADVLSWVADGKLKITVGAKFQLADAREAHRCLEARATTGKVLLIP